MDKLVVDGLARAKRLTRQHGKTFYFASKLLGKDRREAAYAVYAVCRISDDSVDSADAIRQKLIDIETRINSAYGPDCRMEPLFLAFKRAVDNYKIPRDYFLQLTSGMYLDFEKKYYSDFCELYDYCYRVAGVVGLIMLQIFGYRDQQAKKYAVDLGIAMQLTNILRDIKEDFYRGRIYLPQDELRRFGVKESDIRSETVNHEFVDFMKFQIRRARDYYRSAGKGFKLITDKRSRFTAGVMSKIYAAILSEIEKNSYDVFSRRVYVSRGAKLGILARAIIDPELRKNYSDSNPAHR